VIAFAALAGAVPKLGVVFVAGLVALQLVHRDTRVRAGAMLGALVLAPVLLMADIWHSPQLRLVHSHPLLAAALAVAGVIVVCALALAIMRRPWILGPLVVLALPFRVPIAAGGTTSNLLVPLYLVVAAGSLAFIARTLGILDRAPRVEGGRGPAEAPGVTTSEEEWAPARWLQRLLAAYVVLYALQAMYSADFEKALQQMVFFYVPFALMFTLLRGLPWGARELRRVLAVLVVLAVIFVAVGFVEYATKTVILNPKLVVANDVHAYFTVNSVFFDPDIFGRFLALVMICLAAVLLYGRRPQRQAGATALLAVLWGGLVLTLSRSSLGALLAGLATLAALRWKLSRAVLLAVAVGAVGTAAIVISPKTFGLNQGLNGASSGRAGLVSGGIEMFAQRPVWGYGSASFVARYRAEHPRSSQTLAASHTIPVTIAAEQGLIGEVLYLALIVAACMTLIPGARAHPARAAVAAAFVALVFHTLLYAAFLEDPLSWTLLGIGTALASVSALRIAPGPVRSAEMAPAAA